MTRRSVLKEHAKSVVRVSPWIALTAIAMFGTSLFFGIPRVAVVASALVLGIALVPMTYVYWKTGSLLFVVAVVALFVGLGSRIGSGLEAAQFCIGTLGVCSIGLIFSRARFQAMLG